LHEPLPHPLAIEDLEAQGPNSWFGFASQSLIKDVIKGLFILV
jgi:hypothetical protein